MKIVSKPALRVLNHLVQFVMNTLRGFSRNQGLLLAGAIAYYALLSVVPLMILAVIALSRLVDQAELLKTLDRYLEWLVPCQSRAVLAEESIHMLGRDWSLSGLSGVLFYLLGLSAPYCAAGTSRLPPSSLIAT